MVLGLNVVLIDSGRKHDGLVALLLAVLASFAHPILGLSLLGDAQKQVVVAHPNVEVARLEAGRLSPDDDSCLLILDLHAPASAITLPEARPTRKPTHRRSNSSRIRARENGDSGYGTSALLRDAARSCYFDFCVISVAIVGPPRAIVARFWDR